MNTFRTMWKNNRIICVCTLDKKCEHAKACEELEFEIITRWNTKECMDHSAYEKKKGVIKQVRYG